MRTFHKFLLLGLISSVLSLIAYVISLVLNNPNESASYTKYALFSFPGIIFGLTIASFFHSKISPLRILLFVLISAFGYFLSLIIPHPILLDLYDKWPFYNAYEAWDLLYFSVQGVSQGFFVTLAFHLLLSKLSAKQFIFLTLLGGILYSATFLTPLPFNIFGIMSEIASILIWQTGMAAALGWVVEQNEKKKPAKKK